MKNSSLDTFFFYAARIILIVPVIIIFLGLFFKFNQNKSQPLLSTALTPILIPSVSAPKTPVATVSATVDLVGPWSCNFSDKGSTVAAYIQNKNVYVNKDKTDFFLLNGDCLYMWQNNVYTGAKICGVSKYVSIFEQMSNFGFIGVNNLPAMLGRLGQVSNIASNAAVFKNVLNSCKKEQIKNQSIFGIPKNILFKNTSL